MEWNGMATTTNPTQPQVHKSPAVVLPSLKDLCIRATVETCIQASLDVECEEPGSGGCYDMLRLKSRDREKVSELSERALRKTSIRATDKLN